MNFPTKLRGGVEEGGGGWGVGVGGDVNKRIDVEGKINQLRNDQHSLVVK